MRTRAPPEFVREMWREYHLGWKDAESLRRQEYESRMAEKIADESRRAQSRAEWMQWQERMKKLGPPRPVVQIVYDQSKPLTVEQVQEAVDQSAVVRAAFNKPLKP